MKTLLRKHKWLLAIIVIAAVLALSNLGDRFFWGDETNQLFFSQSILRHGLPVVDDQVRQLNTLYETDDVKPVDSIMSYSVKVGGLELYNAHPWLVTYIAALPIALFGPYQEFFVRLPFVLIGLFALPLLYLLALRVSRSKRVALLASILLGLSTVYLLALRNTLYYGIVLAAVPATLLCYLRMLDKKPHAWWQFAIAGTVLFHSQWLIFLGTMLGIALHWLFFHRTLAKLKRVLLPLACIFVLTFPWFMLTGQLSKAAVLSTPLQFVTLLSIGVYHFILWFVPVVLLVFVPSILLIRKERAWTISKEYALLALTIIATVLIASLNYFGGTPIRYFYGLLPLAMILNAAVIGKIAQWLAAKKVHVRAIQAGVLVLVVLLAMTNVINVLPLMPFKPVLTMLAGSQDVLGTGAEAQEGFVAKSLRPRVMLGEYLYEITHSIITPTRAIVDEITKIPNPGRSIFVAAGDANAISYYTGLRPATYPNNFATREYDWISLPLHDPRNGMINQAAYGRTDFAYALDHWGDTADPVHHLFKTKGGEGFVLYHKQ